MSSTVGIRIMKRRTELNMSQDELAKKVGYKDRASISRIENGERDPRQKMLIKIAEALRCTPAYLMGWDDSEAKESPSPVEDEREAYRAMLSDLTDEELIEMKKFTSYLRWKRNHPQGESDK